MSIYAFLLCYCALNLVQISGSELKVAFNCCTKEIPRREDFIIIIYNNFACYAILRVSVPKTLRSAFNNKNITTRTLTNQNISWKLVETYNTMDVAYELNVQLCNTYMTKLTTRMLYRGRTTLGFNCHIAEINSATNKYLSS